MAQYLVAEDWNHIFDERRGEEYVRFVFDTEASDIVAMDFRSSVNRAWEPADLLQIADVKESIVQNYNTDPAAFGSGAIDDPEEFGIELAEEAPDWASGRVAAPSFPKL